MCTLMILSSLVGPKTNMSCTWIFGTLKKANMKVQIDKCEFFKELGFIISQKGVKTIAEKLKAIKQFRVPGALKELRSFLGLVNCYRRFIGDYAKLAKPLTNLL